jgi:ubiquinone/menaquinone biosynthesis C-methylase UbiE
MTHHPHLNYDTIAPEYNQRYDSSPLPERANALFDLAQQVEALRILEVGCGTGFWLNLLSSRVKSAYGLDYSLGMLGQAKGRSAPLRLSRGDAVHLPYQDNSFDLLYCVDAIHHFGKPDIFISEAFRVLRSGGALAVVGSDPHSGDDTWYVYDYFEEVLETDLQRFPNDPFLKKNSCSQLALLSDKAYQTGLEKIKIAAVSEEQLVFRNELFIKMFEGFKPGLERLEFGLGVT